LPSALLYFVPRAHPGRPASRPEDREVP
jgi:hypothetical protein